MVRITFISLLVFLGFSAVTLAQEKPISLAEAIDRSLENATHTRIAKANKEAAEAGSGILSSDYIPTINSSFSYTRSQYPQIVTPIRAQGAFPPLDDQLYEANIQANWEIFDFGESRAMRRKAKALADAANIKYELARMETIESTASAYIQLHQLKELKKVQDERIQTLKKDKEQLKALYREGRIAEVDLLKIDDAIVEAETAVITTENNIDQLLQELSDDLGLEHQLNPDDIAPLTFNEEVLFNPDHATVDNAPSISAAKEQKKAADLEARASYRAFLPQLNLFATELLRTGSEFEIDDQWMVGIRFNIPLFAGKRIVNNQVKKKEAKSQQIQLEQTRQQYRQQLNKLTNAQFETQKRIQSTKTRTKYLEETYRIESKSYTQGRSTLTDLLTTESKLNSVRAELIAMRAQLRILNLNIAVLTGELNKEIAIKLAEGKSL
ncbi:TolC family protein [Fodinibius sp.]|uniref:TolC family protein n=1 Tax=Fodinibius sp. TaxID=1872440 RepID=UPI002ACD35D3|nr:TolC family protein [Fodinibius sp.]MDZ7657689.1 TolC family protein [Fodinibius sp.]